MHFKLRKEKRKNRRRREGWWKKKNKSELTWFGGCSESGQSKSNCWRARSQIQSPMGHWGQATLRPRRWGQRQWGQTTLRPDDVEARRRWGQTTLRPGDVEARYVWVTFPNLNIGLDVATLRPMFGLKVATRCDFQANDITKFNRKLFFFQKSYFQFTFLFWIYFF